MALPSALAPLCAIPNWVLWQLEQREGSDGEMRWTKPPYQAKSPRRHARTSDPETWATYAEAAAAAERLGLDGENGGVGVVIKGSGAGGIDLDKCLSRADDGGLVIAASAREIMQRARKMGLYVEISPSCTGVHIWGYASGGGVHTKWTLKDGVVIEIFRDATRFLTVTGRQLYQEDWEGGDDDWGSIDELIDELVKGRANGHARATNGGGQAASGADSSPSGLFHRAVSKLAEQGLNVEEICAHMRKNAGRYAETSIRKYEEQGRLKEEVERVLAKWMEKHSAQLEVQWSTGRLPKGKNLADAMIAVVALGIECSNDEFHVRHYVAGEVLGRRAGELTDETVAIIRDLILAKYGFDAGKDTLSDALYTLAIKNSFDPVREYLDGLVWDGVERLDDWVVQYLGVEDTELARAIGRKALLAAVRRVRSPGVKFDAIVDLEGPEGIGKSSAIKILAGEESFSDSCTFDMRHGREQQEMFQGVWLAEFPDLKGISAAEQNAIKAFMSRTEDRARPAYGKRVFRQLRRTIFFATTNETSGYLKGGSFGNRRWWPLRCGHIMLKTLVQDRDQLWAEAAVRERGGEAIELPRSLWAAAREAQSERAEQDPWTLRLQEGINSPRYPRTDGREGYELRIHSARLYRDVLGLRASDERGGGTARRLAEAMHGLGWMAKQVRIGGISAAGWIRVYDE